MKQSVEKFLKDSSMDFLKRNTDNFYPLLQEMYLLEIIDDETLINGSENIIKNQALFDFQKLSGKIIPYAEMLDSPRYLAYGLENDILDSQQMKKINLNNSPNLESFVEKYRDSNIKENTSLFLLCPNANIEILDKF